MAPDKRFDKALNHLKPLGIIPVKIRAKLKQLLKVYDNNWKLIEEDDYRVVTDSLFEKPDKVVKSKKKEPQLVEWLPESIPLRKRLRSSHKFNEKPELSPAQNANTQLAIVPLRNTDGEANQLFSYSIVDSETEEYETPLKRSRLRRKQEALVLAVGEPLAIVAHEIKTDVASCSDASLDSNRGKSMHLITYKRNKAIQYKEPRKQSSVASFLNQLGKVEFLVDLTSSENAQPFMDDQDAPLAIAYQDLSHLPSKDSSCMDTSWNKSNAMRFLDSTCASGEDDLLNLIKFDVASSSEGKVKLSLVFNSSQQTYSSLPILNDIMREMDDKLISAYGIDDPNFSLKRVMTEFCDFFMAKATVPANKKQDSLAVTTLVHEHGHSLDVVESYHYLDDITKGEEQIEISATRASSEGRMQTFTYITQNMVYDKAHVKFGLVLITDKDSCVHCTGDCLTSSKPCVCARKTGGQFVYTPEGLVKDWFLRECISLREEPEEEHHLYCLDCPLERSKSSLSNSCKGHLARKFIKECWSKCGCSKRCGNRVVQRGITRKLQVFRTSEGKGWGLRTTESLPGGAFVCEYVGEIITCMELHERNLQRGSSPKYLSPVLLDAEWGLEIFLKDDEALSLDSYNYGNVARFINHRCSDASLIDIPVEVENPDHHYYHLAFFTKRDIAAMEELTWDYGIHFNGSSDAVKSFKCLCGSSFCRDKL